MSHSATYSTLTSILGCGYACTVVSRKYAPTFFAHYFEAKVGRGRLVEYSITLVHTPTRFIAMLHSCMVDDCSDIMEERPAASLNVYYRKSAVLVVLILSREAPKQLAISVMTGDDLTYQLVLRATKPSW